MSPRTPNPLRSASRMRRLRAAGADTGQAALVLVVALTVMLTIFAGVMVSSAVNNAPILTQASIQRYAYRALASGLDAYQNAINANPYLAACNTSTNYSAGPPVVGNAQCAGLSYQTWSEVPGTDVGNGVIPEFYKFDNPVQIKDPTTQAITYLEVQIVGAAGFSGRNVFYSTVAKFTPQNGFLNGVWWSNYESSEFPTGTAADCDYFYNQGRNITNNGTVGNTPCSDVVFITGDKLFGPVYSNDSLYVSGTPSFSGTVNTADPQCLFVDDTNQDSAPACTSLATNGNISYTQAGSGFGHAQEPLPSDNSQLLTVAKQGGCYYEGPTTVTLSVVGGVGKMTVNSPDTGGYNAANPSNSTNDTMNTPTIGDPNCPTSSTQGAQALPTNGVIYVNGASTNVSGANPFDPNTNGASQVKGNCSACYYGQSGTADTEADAFVRGSLSGHLTVAASNDVIIDGAISYNDCSWAGTPSESLCGYNNASTGTNDTLGLIANNYVEVNRPVYNNSASNALRGTPLPDCGSNGALAAPLCDPATTTGAHNGTAQGLTIDATILALSQSFVVNNYGTCTPEGELNIYGSIQQDARGPVGTTTNGCGGQTTTGYLKYYLWDPRLTLYGPPYYLTPGTPSWSLDSSAESYTGTEPSCPPVTPVPVTSATFPISGSTAAGTGTCTAAS